MLKLTRMASSGSGARRGLLAVLLLAPLSLQAETGFETAAVENATIPLLQTHSGSFTLSARMGGVDGEFLLDTGASMVTVSRSLLDSMGADVDFEKVRTVSARLASGKVELLDVYKAEHFIIGQGCDLGPIEFAVVDRGGRNLLGMNALKQVAPFSISFTPPALSLARCQAL